MSKKINTSFASEGQPLRAPLSIDHLQQCIEECTRQSLIASIGPTYSAATAYIIWGLEVSFDGMTGMEIMSPGAVLYGGEIYLTNGGPLPPILIGQTLVVITQISYPSGEPTLFDGGLSHNVHEIRTVGFVAAAPGAGIADYNDMPRVLGAPQFSSIATTTASITVNFRKNRILNYNNSSASGNTITLDSSAASPGCEVVIYVAVVAAGDTLNFAPTTSETAVVLTGTSSLTAVNSTWWIIRMKIYDVISNHIFIEVYNPD